MRCLEGCEFLKFKKGAFNCYYYDQIITLAILDDARGIFEPKRCEKCIEEKMVGNNTIDEAAKKAKFRLGLIGDSFYSFKDDFETELTEIYRILKDLEEKSQND